MFIDLFVCIALVCFQKHKSAEEARKAQKKALCVVPEFCVKDMAQWFTFLAYTVLQVSPDATKGLMVCTLLVGCLADWLDVCVC